MSRSPRALARSRHVLMVALAAANLLIQVGHPGAARAQSATEAAPRGDKAAAETLFNEGRTLLGQNKLAEACPKLAESLRLDTGIGTMLYLAECWERSGKTASAWAQFREAQSVAAREKDAREKVARQRAEKLEPKLVRLAVSVPPESDQPDLKVTRDGVVLGRALWGEETPVDPGPHVVRATATGRVPFESTVTVAPGAPRARVVIPALDPVAAASDASSGTDGASESVGKAGDLRELPAQKIVALGLGGMAVAGVAVGTLFGVKALGSIDEADARCDDRFCDQRGLTLRDEAKDQALVSTVAFAFAGAAVASAIALWVTAPKSGRVTPPPGVLTPVPTRGGMAFVAAARF